MDKNVPLIERIRFLGIFSNNLDEFFRVRVATVRRMESLGKKSRTLVGGHSVEVILDEIQAEVIALKEEFADTYQGILRELRKHDIHIINEKQVSKKQRAFAEEYYNEIVAPLLVPIMLKSIPEFPYLRDISIYLAVKLSSDKEKLKKQYALIEVPSERTPRFVVLPEENNKKYIMFLDDVIRLNLNKIFGIFEYENVEAYTIKITRDAELDLDDDVSKSFYEKMKKGVKQRGRGEPVRFLFDSSMSEDLLKYFMNKLSLDQDDNIISGGRYHNSKDFMKFPSIGGPELEYEKLPQLNHPDFARSISMLEAIKRRDILLQYPYHKFSHFVHFLREAAIDPNVKEIHISLYRVAKQSRVINALINAAKNGKTVTVMIELRARFDEENNLDWSKKLQDEGVKVLYGIPELKVHCKLCVVTKKVADTLNYYAVISTGNFNEVTGKVYSDLALYTSHKEICNEALKVFALIERPYKSYRFNHLLISPMWMRNKYVKLINREIKNAKAGKPASIFMKMNSLVDEPMIKKLYAASEAGVKIRIIIRGICSIVPGVKGLSENIQIRSIIDKYLEHSRVFIFNNYGGEEVIYISSADWMTRNLDYRIESSCAIYDERVRNEIKEMIDLQWADNIKARVIDRNQKDNYVSKRENKSVRAQVDQYNILKEKGIEKGAENLPLLRSPL